MTQPKQEDTERQLFLKQLQINRLLDITQAINNNVSADTLYVMFKSLFDRKSAYSVRFGSQFEALD